MIIQVNSDLENIKNIITKIIEENQNISFVSYVDGEFGIRMMIYASMVSHFCLEQKKLNNKIIGLCFKGLTFYIKDLCDYVIEIQDSIFSFLPDSEDINEDNSMTSENHKKGIVPSIRYKGNDGWNLCYIRGIHCDEYENMLDSFNFKNIFYTTHGDGSRYINKYNLVLDGNFCCGKINDKKLYFNLPNSLLNNYHENNNKYKTLKNNNICVWIRNSNKCPERNMDQNIYNSLFNYCITNKINLHIFLDFNKVNVPINEFLHVYDIKIDYSINLDIFLEICKKCYVFISTNSGITDIVSYFLDTNIILNSNQNYSDFTKRNGVTNIITTSAQMISFLNKFFN